jgi:hypothetical protein
MRLLGEEVISDQWSGRSAKSVGESVFGDVRVDREEVAAMGPPADYDR